MQLKETRKFQHLLSSTKKDLDIIAISETRITKQVSLLNDLNLINNCSFEITATETSRGGTLLYIVNHLEYKCFNDLNIYKKYLLRSTFIEIGNAKNQTLLWQSFTDICCLWILLILTASNYYRISLKNKNIFFSLETLMLTS